MLVNIYFAWPYSFLYSHNKKAPIRIGLGSSSDDDSDESLDHDQRSHEDKRCMTCGEIRPTKILIECTRCGYRHHITYVKVTNVLAKKFTRY